MINDFSFILFAIEGIMTNRGDDFMNQKLTEEQYKIVRDALKENKYIELDNAGDVGLSMRVERKMNKYFFSKLNENLEDAIPENRVKRYQVYLDLVDLESEEPLAQVAYMDINALPHYWDYDTIGMISDEDADLNDTMLSVLKLKEMDMQEKYMEYRYAKYPSSQVNVAELHTCYVSPEFRGLGLVDFLYGQLNDLLNAEYNQVIYLLGVYVNPFVEQVSLEQVKDGKMKYCNEIDKDSKLVKAMYKSLERNGFVSTNEDDRHFYKNMFDDDSYEYYC